MYRLLFLSDDRKAVALLRGLLSEEEYELVTVGTARRALKLLDQETYHVVVVSKPPCKDRTHPGVRQLLDLAKRLDVPAFLFPPDDGSLLPQLEELIRARAGRSRAERGRRWGSANRERVAKIFDEAIRPVFQVQGGDVKLLRVVREGVVIRFLGACAACPTARGRHREEIEAFLRSQVPGVRSVFVDESRAPRGRGR